MWHSLWLNMFKEQFDPELDPQHASELFIGLLVYPNLIQK